MKISSLIFAVAICCPSVASFSVPSTQSRKITNARQAPFETYMSTDDEAPSDVASTVEEEHPNTNDDSLNTSSGLEKVERDLILAKLLAISAATDRGQLANTDEKQQISSLIQQIEALTPSATTPTLQDSMMSGTWELVYSNTQLFRSSPFFMAGRAVCQTPEEAQQYDWFCDMHRAALAISTIGKVRQVVDTSTSKLVSEFEVKVGSIPFLNDYTPFSYSGGLPVSTTILTFHIIPVVWFFTFLVSLCYINITKLISIFFWKFHLSCNIYVYIYVGNNRWSYRVDCRYNTYY